MPIRPENKHRYPSNWKQIRERILGRAGNKCEGIWGEKCGVANHAIVRRYLTQDLSRFKDIKIVLTIAHMDHTPENNDDRNLRALCQRCHNQYDAKFRANNRIKNKLAAMAKKAGKMETVTRCKFKCNSITTHAGGNKDVHMSPVYGDSPENKAFWAASPGGEFKLNWVNPNVSFEPGKEYYIDISLAPAAT